MLITAGYLEGPGTFTPQMLELRNPADATAFVEYWAGAGATSFKAYMHITRAELAAAIAAAHARKLKVTGHLCSVGFREAAALGIDNLEHGLIVDSEFMPGKRPDECPNLTLKARPFNRRRYAHSNAPPHNPHDGTRTVLERRRKRGRRISPRPHQPSNGN